MYCLLSGVIIVALIYSGLFMILRHTQPAQAQRIPSSVSTLLSGSSKGISGGYQQSSYDTTKTYELWSYRSDGIYDTRNRCEKADDGNNIITERDKKLVNKGTLLNPNWVYVRDCINRNEPLPRDNLLKHDWNSRKENPNFQPDELENMQPFLVLGSTTGSGIQNLTLELQVWIPDDGNNRLKIKASHFCEKGDIWDMNSNDYANLSVIFKGKNKAADSKECINDNTEDFEITNIKDELGEPFERQTFTTNAAGGIKTADTPYKLYKIEMRTTDICNSGVKVSCNSYTNQFRLEVTYPKDTAYLGIAETNIEKRAMQADIPNNALGVGMRLPGDTKAGYSSDQDLEFIRLKILWEIELYVAVNPEKGCSGRSIHGEFGLYDHDYPAQKPWLEDDFPPTLEINSIDRNAYLEGTTMPNDWGLAEYVTTFTTNPSNEWDNKVYEEFAADRIYRLHFYNLDQRSWMQIGIPFAQSNALRKCIDRPIVKVYHGDISVGGWFGKNATSNACRGEDPSSLINNGKGHIYAHAALRDAGNYGSSAEYAVYARDEINGFYSGYKRPLKPPSKVPPPEPPDRLTFANTTNDPWGGKLSGELRCIPNWWRRTEHLEDKKDSTTTQFFLNKPNGDPWGEDIEQFYSPPTPHTLTISVNSTSPPMGLDLKAAIYVKGNLLIKEDIINENANLTKLNQVKSIYFIVKGDIFIESNVTRIDAVLIAIPTNDAQTEDGRIFTCYVDQVRGMHDLTYDPVNETEKIPSTKRNVVRKNISYDQNCRNRLTINGALTARQVRLGRVTNPSPPSGYYNADEGSVTEEINFLPEYFIGTPLLPTHTDWYYASDSVTILPVNF